MGLSKTRGSRADPNLLCSSLQGLPQKDHQLWETAKRMVMCLLAGFAQDGTPHHEDGHLLSPLRFLEQPELKPEKSVAEDVLNMSHGQKTPSKGITQGLYRVLVKGLLIGCMQGALTIAHMKELWAGDAVSHARLR